MSHIDQVESCANRDLINHNIDCKVGNGIVAIVNSCDGAVHPVTRHCNRTILTQSIGILTSNTINNNNRNLANHKDLLSTMSSNGRKILKHWMKCSKIILRKNILLVYWK